MMAAEEEPPTLTQIEIIRNEIKDRVSKEAPDIFDDRDLNKLMTDNFYVGRFWIHAFFIPGNRIENTVNLVFSAFKWRKDFGVNDISEEDLDNELLDKGSLYYHNRDKLGCRLLVFSIRKHSRDARKVEAMKKMLIYILERLDSEEGGKRITIIFDSESAGLGNFDLELVKFLIHVLINFYPNFVNKILVFEMPWILNTAWKMIKSLLPPPAVARIQFVNKTSIKNLIAVQQLPLSWGGEDDWEYDWASFIGGGGGGGVVGGGESPGPGGYKISPGSLLKFVPVSKSRDLLEAEVSLTNTSPTHLAVKVKTTEPGMFRVRPHITSLAPHQEVKINIQTSGLGHSQQLLNIQQFQLVLAQTEQALEKDDLYRLFMSPSTAQEKVVLRCEVKKPAAENKTGQVRVLRDKVDTLEDKIESLYKVLAIQAAIISLVILYKMIFS